MSVCVLSVSVSVAVSVSACLCVPTYMCLCLCLDGMGDAFECFRVVLCVGGCNFQACQLHNITVSSTICMAHLTPLCALTRTLSLYSVFRLHIGLVNPILEGYYPLNGIK